MQTPIAPTNRTSDAENTSNLDASAASPREVVRREDFLEGAAAVGALLVETSDHRGDDVAVAKDEPTAGTETTSSETQQEDGSREWMSTAGRDEGAWAHGVVGKTGHADSGLRGDGQGGQETLTSLPAVTSRPATADVARSGGRMGENGVSPAPRTSDSVIFAQGFTAMLSPLSEHACDDSHLRPSTAPAPRRQLEARGVESLLSASFANRAENWEARTSAEHQMPYWYRAV